MSKRPRIFCPLLVLGALTISGCSSSPPPAPAAAKPQAARPAAPNPVPQKTPLPAKTKVESVALPEPAGDLVADTRLDLKATTNKSPDFSGSGEWSCQVSGNDNFVKNPGDLQLLEWDPKYAPPQFRARAGKVPDASRPRIGMAEEGELRMVSSSFPRNPQYALLHWTSGVEGEIAVQGRFRLTDQTIADGTELQIYVDGMLQFKETLQDDKDKSAGKTFDFRVDVMAGSGIAFVVEPNSSTAKEDGIEDELLLIARIGKTSSTAESFAVPADIAEKVSQRWNESPRRPIPNDKDLSQSVGNWGPVLAWWRKQLIEPFRTRHAATSIDLNKGEAALETICRMLADVPAPPSRADLALSGIASLETGLQDPLLDAFNAVLANEHGGKDAEMAKTLMVRADAKTREQPYPPIGMMLIHRWRWRMLQQPIDLTLIASHLEQAMSAEGLTDFDRELLAQLVGNTVRYVQTLPGVIYIQPPPIQFEIAASVYNSQRMDPWLRHLLLAQEYRRLGWIARGNGTANTVPPESWRLFKNHLARARAHALQAWQLKPQLPEGATEMISISMAGQGVGAESTRFWFDEAMQADFTFQRAYTDYAWSLRPRWGGSHAKMQALAEECAATERYDTIVPTLYRTILAGVAEERGGWTSIISPRVYQGFQQYLRGYIQDPTRSEEDRRVVRSQLAAVAYLASDDQEAQRQVQELGDKVDKDALTYFGVATADLLRSVRDDVPTASYFADDPGDAVALAFTANAGELVVADRTGKLQLWNATTKQLVRTLQGRGGPIVALYPSADSARLLSVSREGKVVAWDTKTWQPLAEWSSAGTIPAAAWSGDGKQAMLIRRTEGKSEVVTWDIDQAEPHIDELSAEFSPTQFSYGPQGHGLLLSPNFTGEPDENLLALNLNHVAWDVRELFNRQVTAWTLPDPGKHLVVAGIDAWQRDDVPSNTIHAVDLESGNKTKSSFWIPSTITALLAFAGGERVAGLCKDGSVFVWNAASGKIEGCRRSGVKGLHGLAASPQHSFLAALDGKGRIHVWPLTDKQLGWQIDAPLLSTNMGGWVRDLKFVAADRLSVESGYGGLSYWDPAERCGHSEEYSLGYGLVAFPHGARAARLYRPEESQFDVIELADEKVLKSWGLLVYVARISSDGKMLAIGDDKGTVTVLDAETLEPFAWGTLAEHRQPVIRLVFSADDRSLVSVSAEGVMKWWDLPADRTTKTNKLVSRLTMQATPGFPPNVLPSAVVVSPDGSLIAVSRSVTDVFDAETGRKLFSVDGQVGLAFSADSRRLCVGSVSTDQRAAKVYDARDGAEQLTLSGGHRGRITAVAFSPDGKIILTGGSKGEVRAWNAQSGEEFLDWPAAEKQ